MRILHIYSLVSIGMLAQTLNQFVTYLFKWQNVCDMIVQVSEYLLMGKYSLVGCLTLILYDIIDGRYVVTGNLYYL